MFSRRSTRVSKKPAKYVSEPIIIIKRRTFVIRVRTEPKGSVRQRGAELSKPPRKVEWVPPNSMLPLMERKELADRLFRENRHSDEYYTSAWAWKDFADMRNIRTVWEPFAGDGAIADEWNRTSVDCIMGVGDFWKQSLPQDEFDYIATNPPFSSKWLVLETLLEHKKPLAVILPWNAFYRGGLERLEWLRKTYGGRWMKHKIPDKGLLFWHPPANAYKKIGCYILEWTW